MNLPVGMVALLVGVLVATLPCNATAQAEGRVPGAFDHNTVEGYRPSDRTTGALTAEAALDVIGGIAGQRPRGAALREAIGGFRYNFFIDRREISAFRPVADVRKLELYEDRIEFQLSRQDRGPSTYYFHEMPASMEIVRDGYVVWMYGVTISKDWVLWCSDGGLLEENRAACAKQLADALHALRRSAENASTDDQKFQEVVAQYRALGPKPVIPEEVRRFKVQAEFMIGQRRYVDAIRIYSDALKVAPWWPEGRFNRALLLAESKRYKEAIQEMNRYVMLEPDGPDGRVARDRIYQWEAAMKMGVR